MNFHSKKAKMKNAAKMMKAVKTKKAKMKKVTKGSVGFSSDSLPPDLIMEILKLVPLKTITRFLSVSKLWASIIRGRDFMKLFLNESLNRTRGLVLLYQGYDEDFALSSEQPRFDTHEASSSIDSLATYHVTYNKSQDTFMAPSVHGLICYVFDSSRLAIYNPCTRRSITLPTFNSKGTHINQYLGYDPINNDCKMLCVTREGKTRGLAMEMGVLTLGSGNSWKMIRGKNIPPHSPISQDLCINGVLYYRAFIGMELKNSAIVSFDVRSEKLSLIRAEKLDLVKGPRIYCNFSKLTSYEGKLAVIFFEREHFNNVALWVLEDAAKEEWSRKTFVLPKLSSYFPRFQSTDTNTCEIIFSRGVVGESEVRVDYCDLKKNRARIVQIKGIPQGRRVNSVYSGLVENLMFL